MERVLLVDDEAEALEVLGWVLSDYGCDVQVAMAGEEALKVSKRFRPTVLITDYFLSGDVTGLDVIRQLRADAPELKAILVTGMPAEALRVELQGLGDVPVVSKPFRWTDIQGLLGLGESRNRVISAALTG